MVDRIDIFDDEQSSEEPEAPKFLGVEQEKLGLSDYTGNFVNFFNQYYGMDSLGSGLEDTGVGVDDSEDITELTTPTIGKETGGDDKDIGTFESSFPGANISDVSYDYSGGANPYDSYSDALKGQNVMTDRVPMTENLFEPLLSKSRFGEFNFDDIDLKEAFTGEYEAAKTTLEEAPGKLGDILKGNITENQKKKLIGGLFSAAAPLVGGTIGSLISGEQMQNAFGKTTTRPSGPLGIAFDLTQTVQFNDMANIRAAHAANAQLKATVGSSVGTMDFGEAGRSMSSMAPTGFAMKFGGMNFGVTRSPGSVHYNGNTMGMSRSQLEAMDALSKGMIPSGFNVRTETGTTITEAGWQDTGKTSSGKGQGYYTSTGSFYSPSTNSYSAYGLQESAVAAAAKAGISLDAFNDALSAARKGTATLEDGIKAAQQAQTDKAEADRQEAAREAANKARIEAEQRGLANKSKADYMYGGGGGGGGLSGREAASAGMSSAGGMGGNPGNKSTWARGGQVGYAFGTPEGGVQQPSGFIDAPPSQVADGQKVADNRDMEVKEGTYVLNAAAVEFAGEQDIRKMIMDAQKEAVRRGLSTEDFERHSDLVDIAVSSGEVTVAPHLVKIIGEDRLEKINKRGIRKTEQRIAENEQQPAQAARGGFLA